MACPRGSQWGLGWKATSWEALLLLLLLLLHPILLPLLRLPLEVSLEIVSS